MDMICHNNIPKEYTSAAKLYGSDFATSGAMYSGDPVYPVNLNVPSRNALDVSTSAARPTFSSPVPPPDLAAVAA